MSRKLFSSLTIGAQLRKLQYGTSCHTFLTQTSTVLPGSVCWLKRLPALYGTPVSCHIDKSQQIVYIFGQFKSFHVLTFRFLRSTGLTEGPCFPKWSGKSRSGFQIVIWFALLISHTCYVFRLSYILLFDLPLENKKGYLIKSWPIA
jgi:hypothetical protein